jgi:hypothetical protein
MSLELESLDDLKNHIGSFPGIPLFYWQNTNEFKVLAGRVSWRGSLDHKKDVEEFEQWLGERGAKRVKGFKTLEELFS